MGLANAQLIPTKTGPVVTAKTLGKNCAAAHLGIVWKKVNLLRKVRTARCMQQQCGEEGDCARDQHSRLLK